MKKLLLPAALLCVTTLLSQKKALDHTVYDGWQSVGEKIISDNGVYVAYAVNPQEGDGNLYIHAAQGGYQLVIPRGYDAQMTKDSRFLVCKIRAYYTDTRKARIAKKKPEDMPKDSLAIVELGTDHLFKTDRVKSFRLPEESSQWLAYLREKALPVTPAMPDSAARIQHLLHAADSLQHVADSIRMKAAEAQQKGLKILQPAGRTGNTRNGGVKEDPVEEGTQLVLRNLQDGSEQVFELVSEYLFDKKGTTLVLAKTRKNGDTHSEATLQKITLHTGAAKLVLQKYHEVKSLELDESGTRLAFIAERDSSAKALQKFYAAYFYQDGMDSARMVANRFSKGMPADWSVSAYANVAFSKSGKRLMVGLSPILPPKDTSLPEIDRVSLDVWHYKDDYVQPEQLKTLEVQLRKNYPALVDMAGGSVIPLINDHFRSLYTTEEGDGKVFYAAEDYGKRIASQWQGYTLVDIFRVDPETGAKQKIVSNFKGNIIQPSYSGKYLLYYDEPKKIYQVYNAKTGQSYAVAKDIPFPLYDEDNDVPDDPNAYGTVKWTEGDRNILLYDRYDIWQVDPEGKKTSVCLTGGRANKIQYRYVNTDRDEKFLKDTDPLLLHLFDEKDKSAGLAVLTKKGQSAYHLIQLFKEPVSLGFAISKAKNADQFLYTKESFEQSPNAFTQSLTGPGIQLSHTNPQQAQYNWGTSELFKWKAYTDKLTEGVLYKPEDFDPQKKYPMIVYFYERNNNTLHSYQAPAPTPSRLNISFFVSRGYIVFVPDIWYKTGHPGQSAYDYIVSGTRAVVKLGFVDSTKMGLQGQSWGGYQIVYLITKTPMYAAAWAGAPVANMTSAYGGIRWGSGLLRQFQYEKTQSRIGGDLWNKLPLYMENSALFSLPKVTTPLVIMANDADDAVPWYQGIEMFAGMRRLGKKVWMLTYNGEAHNLVQRKNRKDIQIREQEFFDYMLKGDKPARWISEGVPAVLKGRDLGLGY